MKDFSEKTTNLKERITWIFANVSTPKGSVAEHKCEECFEIRQIFTGKEWRTLTPEVLEANYDKLPLFSHEAYHCFLPAYLIYSLDNIRENIVYEFTCYNFMLKSNSDESILDWQLNRYQNFTKAQLHTVVDFMDLVIQEEIYEDSNSELKRGKQFLIDHVEPTLEI